MLECGCGRWYNLDQRPTRCECGQPLRLTPEEVAEEGANNAEEDEDARNALR